MTKKINLNDSSAWQSLDWNEPTVHPSLKKSDTTVNRSRSAFFKRDNPEFSDTMKSVAAERNQNPEYIEAYQQGMATRDNSYQAEVNARPEVRAKHSQNHKGKPKSDAHKASLKATTTNKPGDPTWEAAHKAGLAKRDKPFHAGEYGVFPSIAEAARQVEEQGLLKNAYKKFSKWKKDKPNEYYFIEN